MRTLFWSGSKFTHRESRLLYFEARQNYSPEQSEQNLNKQEIPMKLSDAQIQKMDGEAADRQNAAKAHEEQWAKEFADQEKLIDQQLKEMDKPKAKITLQGVTNGDLEHFGLIISNGLLQGPDGYIYGESNPTTQCSDILLRPDAQKNLHIILFKLYTDTNTKVVNDIIIHNNGRIQSTVLDNTQVPGIEERVRNGEDTSQIWETLRPSSGKARKKHGR